MVSKKAFVLLAACLVLQKMHFFRQDKKNIA